MEEKKSASEVSVQKQKVIVNLNKIRKSNGLKPITDGNENLIFIPTK